MTRLTAENSVVGLYIHEASITGNLYVQRVTGVHQSDGVFITTEYLQPTRPVYPTYYRLSGNYRSHTYLGIIQDPVDFVRGHWLVTQARYAMEQDRWDMGQRFYNECRGQVALLMTDRWQKTLEWKETIDHKRWLMCDYFVPEEYYLPPHKQKRLREARSWSKADHQYNGPIFWAVIEPDDTGRSEWTTKIECLRRVGHWFDDAKYRQEVANEKRDDGQGSSQA
jgi:hypothetical protein